MVQAPLLLVDKHLIPFELSYPAIYTRRGALWAKHMGLKEGATGNTNGNLGNPLGTKEK